MIRQRLGFWTAMVMLIAAGCAKQPATAVTSAPPPTGGTTATTAAPSDSNSADSMRAAGGSQPAATARPSSPALSSSTPGRPPVQGYEPTAELQDVHFDFDKYDIRPGDARVLDANAAWLKTNPDRLLLIEGHCDERGTSEYNLALGERRARAAMNYLVSQGVAASRMTFVSYGADRPSCTEHSEACWAQNRRAHFLTKRG